MNFRACQRAAKRHSRAFFRWCKGCLQYLTAPLCLLNELIIGKTQYLPAGKNQFVLPPKLPVEGVRIEFPGMGMKTVKFYGKTAAVLCPHSKIKTAIPGWQW